MKTRLLILIVSMLPSCCVLAETAYYEPGQKVLDRFALWTDCEPIGTQFFMAPYQVYPRGVAEETVEKNVKSRLERAGILREDTDQSIAPAIRINRTTYRLSLEFSKAVTDNLSGEVSHVTTWKRSVEGYPVSYPEFYPVVDGLVDEFIREFLRVNMEACAGDH